MDALHRLLPSRSNWKPVALVALCFTPTACGVVSSHTFAIAEGNLAPNETGVVFIEIKSGTSSSQCSGSLILPDLVLTAAHCVTGQLGPLPCASTQLAVPLTPQSFRVSAAPDLSGAPDPNWSFQSVRDVSLLGSPGDDLCGADVALLHLGAPLTGAESLSLATLPSNAASLSLVGYGAGHTSGTGEKVRRNTSATVVCRGSACDDVSLQGAAGAPAVAAPPVTSHEFITTPGACLGDSGGPALHNQNVVGVLSRGLSNCRAPVYGLPFEAVAQAVRAHAQLTGQDIPAWAQPSLTTAPDTEEPAPTSAGGAGGRPGDSPPPPSSFSQGRSDSHGCSLHPGRDAPASSSLFWLALTALGGLTLTRRQRSLDQQRLKTPATAPHLFPKVTP